MRVFFHERWPALALGALLLGYYLYPLAAMLAATSPAEILAALGDPQTLSALWVSLATATVTTLLALLLGVPLAWWLARAPLPGRRLLEALILLPLVLPPTVGGVALLQVFGASSSLGRAGASLGLPLTRSYLAIVLAQLFVASPLLIITAQAAFSQVDRRLEQASRTLGVGPWQTFFRVTLPLARAGILAGALLTWARALGEFGATLMMAYNPRTMPVQTWVDYLSRGLSSALPLAVIILAIALIAVLSLRALAGKEARQHER